MKYSLHFLSVFLKCTEFLVASWHLETGASEPPVWSPPPSSYLTPHLPSTPCPPLVISRRGLFDTERSPFEPSASRFLRRTSQRAQHKHAASHTVTLSLTTPTTHHLCHLLRCCAVTHNIIEIRKWRLLWLKQNILRTSVRMSVLKLEAEYMRESK